MIKKDFISRESRTKFEYGVNMEYLHKAIIRDLEWFTVFITILVVCITVLIQGLGV